MDLALLLDPFSDGNQLAGAACSSREYLVFLRSAPEGMRAGAGRTDRLMDGPAASPQTMAIAAPP